MKSSGKKMREENLCENWTLPDGWGHVEFRTSSMTTGRWTFRTWFMFWRGPQDCQSGGYIADHMIARNNADARARALSVFADFCAVLETKNFKEGDSE